MSTSPQVIALSAWVGLNLVLVALLLLLSAFRPAPPPEGDEG